MALFLLFVLFGFYWIIYQCGFMVLQYSLKTPPAVINTWWQHFLLITLLCVWSCDLFFPSSLQWKMYGVCTLLFLSWYSLCAAEGNYERQNFNVPVLKWCFHKWLWQIWPMYAVYFTVMFWTLLWVNISVVVSILKHYFSTVKKIYVEDVPRLSVTIIIKN